MANFNQAVHWLKEGKKVRRNSWGNKTASINTPSYSRMLAKYSDNEAFYKFTISDFEARDWEIYAPKPKDFRDFMKRDDYLKLAEPTEMMCESYFMLDELNMEAERVHLHIQDKIKEWENGKSN